MPNLRAGRQTPCCRNCRVDIFRQERFQRNRQRCHVLCFPYTIHRCTSTITSNQQPAPVRARGRAGWLSRRAFVRGAPNRSTSFERQQEHHFVSLGNASQCLRLDGLGCRQKAMSPAVRGAEVNSQGTQSLAASDRLAVRAPGQATCPADEI